jgi:hypothetical protein
VALKTAEVPFFKPYLTMQRNFFSIWLILINPSVDSLVLNLVKYKNKGFIVDVGGFSLLLAMSTYAPFNGIIHSIA